MEKAKHTWVRIEDVGEFISDMALILSALHRSLVRHFTAEEAGDE